jgi:thioredoxin reductase (NADPH)
MGDAKNVDVVILGSGPAGNTAAIYLGRAGLKPVVLAGISAPGGALTNTTDVENFPGFPNGVSGAELVGLQQKQAEKFGAIYEYDEAADVDFSQSVKKITTEMGEIYHAKAVIITTGSVYRKLGVVGEEEFAGRGVSYCATCDGFFFKERDLVVVGGGDTAMEEALYLANLASSVKLIHRRDAFRSSQIMEDRVRKHENIEIITPAVIEEIVGGESGKVEKIVLKNTEDNSVSELPVSGVFVAIGSDPQTTFLKGKVELTDSGYVKIDGHSPKTNVPGVFAAGDCADPDYRQAIVAAGSGAKAAIEAERYIG